ncbi:Down syndrome cell adhesion molecule-like protein Dscam2 isoform X2 [Melanotaenia boesemani]|uniref:Down syndrome cell adhesion molecule-like protein Dscam2 isoform X2 n=1 Tax=Melanotaenia boesemani TaxID=1250792 RepID=UPI001C0428FA|nr:Down syndrome cell adhesion molecule-like protein Dscam2 isoform X2 [Melanotaenia boesemani]
MQEMLFLFWTLFLWSNHLSASQGDAVIRAQPGHDVSLPCRAEQDGDIDAVEWSRPDLGSEYVIFYKDRRPVPHYQHPSYQNRADLRERQMKDGDVSLILKNLRIKDTGKYKCKIRQTGTHTMLAESIIQLEVSPPPGQRNITAEPGQDVSLPCRAGHDGDITAVRWIRPDQEPEYVLFYEDGRLFLGPQHPSFYNRVDLQDRQMTDGDVSLILKNLMTYDTGTYECRVFQRRRGSRIAEFKSIAIINLEVSPPEQRNITAEPGHDVSLPCRARHDGDITAVRWTRPDQEPEDILFYEDGRPFPDHQHSSYQNRVDLQDRQMTDGNVSLILKTLIIKDTGIYKCRVQQTGTDTMLTESIIHLEVSPPPEQRNITAEPGHDISLPCRARHDGDITAVRWTRPDQEPEDILFYEDGRPFPDPQHSSYQNRVDLQDRQMTDGNVSLILKTLTINDSGIYKCRVRQTGTDTMLTESIIHLKVSPPPEQRNITADPGHDISLPCRARHVGDITAVRWTRPDQEPEDILFYEDGRSFPDPQHSSYQNRVDLQDRQMTDGNVSLILKTLTINDSGIYKCRVRQTGTDTMLTESIIHLKVPPPPEQRNITAEPGHDISLPCRARHDGDITAVRWTRPDQEPEDILFYEDGRSFPDHQHSSYQNRVDLQDRQMTDGNVSLILKTLTINDSGIYKCRVRQTGTDTMLTESIIHLKVPPPPEQRNITAEPGHDISLPCRARHDGDITAVRWTRPDQEPEDILFYEDGRPFPDHQHSSYQNRVDLQDRQMTDGNVSLILKTWTINDSGIYKCRVRQTGTDTMLTESIIHLKVPPPPEPSTSSWTMGHPALLVLLVLVLIVSAGVLYHFRFYFMSVYKVEVESGVESVLLPCRTTVHLPGDAKVEWTDGNRTVHVYQNGFDQLEDQHQDYRTRTVMERNPLRSGDLSLTLKLPTYGDNRIFTCSVYSREGNILMKKQVLLTVRVPQVEVKSGAESVLLPCRTTVHLPGDAKVEWKDGYRTVHVYQNSSDQLEKQDQVYRTRTVMERNPLQSGDLSLTLKLPTYGDNRTFTCRVYSREEIILMKKQVHLIVRVWRVEVEEGAESVLLPFRTTPDLPEDADVMWWRLESEPVMKVHMYHNGSDKTGDQDQVYRTRTKMHQDLLKTGDLSLTLKNPKLGDSGRYRCEVRRRQDLIRWKKVQLKVKGTGRVQDQTEDIRTRSGSDDPTPLMADQSV